MRVNVKPSTSSEKNIAPKKDLQDEIYEKIK